MNLTITQQKIEQFFKESGLYDGTLTFTFDEKNNTLWCSLMVSDSRLFTGKNGEVLSALNHLVRKIVESDNEENTTNSLQVIVDVNNFQKRKIENLHAVAHMMAERARFFKSSVEVDPMSAFERRVIHEYLANTKDIKTESTGEGPYRRVVIKYSEEEKI